MVDINLTIVVQAINFLLLVFVLKRVLWEPLMRHMDRRDGLIAGRKEEIEKVQAESQKMREEHSTRIRAARKEGIKLRDDLIRDGRVERLRLIDEAMDEAEGVVSEGEKELQAAKRAALLGVNDEEIASMADQIVSRILSVANI